MSSESLPITTTRFAAALSDLPISSLHAKVSELRNSISHLQASNAQLEEFVRQEADKDCYEALMENKEVIRRMEERIELVKREITDVRGLPIEPEPVKTEGTRTEGDGEMSDQAPAADGRNGTGTDARNGEIGTVESGEGEDEDVEATILPDTLPEEDRGKA